ncbi:hypothetical protein Tco_0686030 [Tanacetum coccineum]
MVGGVAVGGSGVREDMDGGVMVEEWEVAAASTLCRKRSKAASGDAGGEDIASNLATSESTIAGTQSGSPPPPLINLNIHLIIAHPPHSASIPYHRLILLDVHLTSRPSPPSQG